MMKPILDKKRRQNSRAEFGATCEVWLPHASALSEDCQVHIFRKFKSFPAVYNWTLSLSSTKANWVEPLAPLCSLQVQWPWIRQSGKGPAWTFVPSFFVFYFLFSFYFFFCFLAFIIANFALILCLQSQHSLALLLSFLLFIWLFQCPSILLPSS